MPCLLCNGDISGEDVYCKNCGEPVLIAAIQPHPINLPPITTTPAGNVSNRANNTNTMFGVLTLGAFVLLVINSSFNSGEKTKTNIPILSTEAPRQELPTPKPTSAPTPKPTKTQKPKPTPTINISLKDIDESIPNPANPFAALRTKPATVKPITPTATPTATATKAPAPKHAIVPTATPLPTATVTPKPNILMFDIPAPKLIRKEPLTPKRESLKEIEDKLGLSNREEYKPLVIDEPVTTQ